MRCPALVPQSSLTHLHIVWSSTQKHLGRTAHSTWALELIDTLSLNSCRDKLAVHSLSHFTHLLAHLGAWHTQGETMVLHMNTSLNTKEPYSQFWTRVDGGPLIAHTVAPGTPTYNVSLCDPTCTASPTHLLEVIVKSTSETIPRWVATHQASSLHLPSPCRIQLYSRTCVFSLTVVWIWNLDCVVLCMC
jgi:hypothetical protein